LDEEWRRLKETDKAFRIADKRFGFYNNGRKYGQMWSHLSDVLLLLVGAATTLAAAVGASRWVTAPLAASAFALAGLPRIFDWQDTWLRFGHASDLVVRAMNDYWLLPEASRNLAAQQLLVQRVNEIIEVESGTFQARRRSLSKPSSPAA
jgi:hypothetical protein